MDDNVDVSVRVKIPPWKLIVLGEAGGKKCKRFQRTKGIHFLETNIKNWPKYLPKQIDMCVFWFESYNSY